MLVSEVILSFYQVLIYYYFIVSLPCSWLYDWVLSAIESPVKIDWEADKHH